MSNRMKEELLKIIGNRKCSAKEYWSNGSTKREILGYYNRKNQPILGMFEDMEREFIDFLNSNRRNFKIIAEYEFEDTKTKAILKISATEKDKIKLSLEPYN